MFKNLGQLNQNLKSHSVMAGVEKLGFPDYNKHMVFIQTFPFEMNLSCELLFQLHFMHYDYSPCVVST